MILFIRFPSDSGFPPAAIEEIVQGCVGRAGSVIGASATAIDVEVQEADALGSVMTLLAAELRGLGMPPSTMIDIPARGQRFSINDF